MRSIKVGMLITPLLYISTVLGKAPGHLPERVNALGGERTKRPYVFQEGRSK